MNFGQLQITIYSDSAYGESLGKLLSEVGYRVDVVTETKVLSEQVRSNEMDLLIADANLLGSHPADGGRRLDLTPLEEIGDKPAVIVLSANASVSEAVQAMRAGAVDYLAIPVSRERFLKTVELGLSIAASSSTKELASVNIPRIVTQDKCMKSILDTLRRVADSDATVLITGESGTGKELLAAYIHAHSGRADQPFVAMNCAALPEQLAESELFGHEKGAFTGAIQRKPGRFEQAHKGTLLLDEVGEMPLNLQAKLLRVLQERIVDRVGGQAPVCIDTRVVATTNRDLKQMVGEGTFREDLYYRLKVLPFELPALRERREDIPLLVETFIERFNERHRRSVIGIATEALERLEKYPWPGNIRELANALERAVLISQNETLRSEDLLLDAPDAAHDTESAISPGTTVKEMERRLILSTLGQVNANRTRAAEMLGISIRTLRNKLNEYRGENPEVFKATG
jgi:two-component system response regulator FlrC